MSVVDLFVNDGLTLPYSTPYKISMPLMISMSNCLLHKSLRRYGTLSSLVDITLTQWVEVAIMWNKRGFITARGITDSFIFEVPINGRAPNIFSIGDGVEKGIPRSESLCPQEFDFCLLQA